MARPHGAPAPNDDEEARAAWAFARGLPARIQQIDAARQAGDLAEARRLARKLRGTAACFGALAMEQAALALESELYDPGDAATALLAHMAALAERDATLARAVPVADASRTTREACDTDV